MLTSHTSLILLSYLNGGSFLKSRLPRQKRLGSAILLIFYAACGVLAAMVFILAIRPTTLAGSLLAAILCALSGCLITFAGQYLLVTLPLKRLRHRELEPLAVARSIPYSSFGLAITQYILSAFDDFRLQREAFGRLSDAYRALAQLNQASLTIKSVVGVAFNAGLAQHVTALSLDLVSKEAEPLAAGQQIMADEILSITQEIEADKLEFVQDGVFWLATPVALSSSHYLVLKVEPRKLWAKTPKMYRRFFSTLASLIIAHILTQEQLGSGARTQIQGEHPEPTPGKPSPPPPVNTLRPSAAGISPQGNLFGDLPANGQGHTRTLLYINNAAAPNDALSVRCLGYSQRKGVRHSADLLCLSYSSASQRSLIFLGAVPQPTHDAGMGSRAALALFAESLTALNLSLDPKETLQSAAQAIEHAARLVFRMFDGQVALALACIHFDYQSGKGSIACFGHPAPYLVSPDERKPLSISTPGLDDGLIGLNAEVRVRFTEFTVMPGQFLAACTIGVLSIRDSERKSFEKEILRGRLSMIDPAVLRSSAGEIAEAIIDEAEKQNSSSILTEDLTIVCLTPADTFQS